MSMQRAVVLGWVVACGMSVATAAELGPDSSVTIVPVIMAGDPSKDVADVVGVMLEQEGMPNIRTVEQEFVPAAGASLEQVAESFGTHASAQSLKTDCALFAEFVGTPKTGVAEIRAVLVDSAGKVLWNDCQKPGDADFDRVRPQNPMTCCVLLRDRLKPVFKLTDATRSQAKEGRMAKLWADKSGTPSDKERAAIGERLETLKEAGAAATVLVYPVQLYKETDAASAEHIVKLLNEAKLCQAQAARPTYSSTSPRTATSNVGCGTWPRRSRSTCGTTRRRQTTCCVQSTLFARMISRCGPCTLSSVTARVSG